MANFLLFQINCTVIMRLAQQPKTPPTRAWATAPFTQTAPTPHRLAPLPPREETTRRCPHPQIRRAPTAMATERRRRKCWRRMRTRAEITRCTAQRIPVQWLATKAITVTTVRWFETLDRISERTRGDATPALLSFSQAGDISSPGENSTVSACIRALEHRTRARTPDTATRIISQHRLTLSFIRTLLTKKMCLFLKMKCVFFFFFCGLCFSTNTLLGCSWIWGVNRCMEYFCLFVFYLYCTVLISVLIKVKNSLHCQPFLFKSSVSKGSFHFKGVTNALSFKINSSLFWRLEATVCGIDVLICSSRVLCQISLHLRSKIIQN